MDLVDYVIIRAVPGSSTRGQESATPDDPFCNIASMGLTVSAATAAQAAAAQRDPLVLGNPQDARFKLHAPTESVDVDAGMAQWGIDAVGALGTPYGGRGIKVAILDTGIDAKHEAFKHLRGRLTVEDFTGEGPDDSDGHGTHCAGTIFGGEVGGRRIGVAPNIAEALVAKVFDSDGGTTSHTIFAAIEWAVKKGAQIISMSLGFDYPEMFIHLKAAGYPEAVAASNALVRYASNVQAFGLLAKYLGDRAKAAGQVVLFVAATGNESLRKQNPKFVVNASPPAAAPGFIAVGALELLEGGTYGVAAYSNSGAHVCAPGSRIVSARAGGGLVAKSGTSQAAPHVAGVAALWAEQILAQGGQLTLEVLRSRLEGYATRQRFAQKFEAQDVGTGCVQAPVVDRGAG